MAVDGLDVSAQQGQVDWAAAPGVLGIAKATEGNYYRDTMLMPNLEGLAGTHKRPGAYHFVRAGINWADQARYFLSAIGQPIFHDDILALDLEPYPGEPWPLGPDETVANTLLFLETVHDATGVLPWLYTYPSFMQMLSVASHFDDLATYPLWWADPSNQNPAPWPPALIQTGQGQVSGVAGDVDLNSLGPAYNDTLPTPIPPPTEEDVLYSTNDNGKIQYYRDASGFLVPLEPVEAAAYYPGVKDGKIVVVELGGPLAAAAYNIRTKAAYEAVGFGDSGGPAPTPVPTHLTGTITGTLS